MTAAPALLPPPEVTFEADTHTYRNAQGTVYQSVTTLLKAAFPFDEQRIATECSQNRNSRYYGQKPADIIAFWNSIAETGTELHKAVEAWNRTGMVPAESERCHDAVNFFASGKWKGQLHPEQIVWCHDHQLAGTIDLIEDCGEALRLWDIKTSRRIDGEKHEKFSLQLFIYARMLSALLNRPVTPRGIIWFEDFKAKPTQKPKVLPLLPLEARATALLAQRKAALRGTPKVNVALEPDIASRLRDYQRPTASQLISGFNQHRFMLDASDLGSGKSYVALAACQTLGLKPIIICRKAAFSAWQRVAVNHFGFPPADITIGNYEKVRTGNSPLGTWVKKLFGKRKIEVFQWNVPDDSVLLLDEVHACAGNRTQNSDLLMSAAYQKIRTIGLSATAASSPLKMRALGYALGLHHGRDFDEWCYAHGCEQGKFGMEFTCGIPRSRLYRFVGGEHKWAVVPEVQAELETLQRAVMGRIHQAIFAAGKGVRIRISEVPGFPEIEIVPYAMDFDTRDEIAAAYAELKAELAAMKDKRHRLAILKHGQQKIELLKCDLIAEEARDLVAEGFSVPLFVNFTASLQKLADLCKTDCRVYGEQTSADRARSLDEFQSNRKHIIVLNNQAGGESIGLHDLHGERQRVSYVSPTFWSELMKQVFGRTRRDGAQSKSIMRVAFAAGTDEERALAAFERKMSNLDAFNDNDAQAALFT